MMELKQMNVRKTVIIKISCKSADFIEEGGRCILYKTNCVESKNDCHNADGDGVSHWMKPVPKGYSRY